MEPAADIVVVGAGAAGLMAAISAGLRRREMGCRGRIVVLDGARTIGAKILVAGGGRCNVTHHRVDEHQYAPVHARNAIRRVLGRFTVEQTVAFFLERGVELKREDTGKLFPTTDRARTVLDALLREISRLDVELVHPWRVDSVRVESGQFRVFSTDSKSIFAKRLILATGGMSLPKTGSDGAGYAFARLLGHSIVPHVFPALVPLVLEPGHFLTSLSGITLSATLEVRSGTSKRLVSFTNSLLFTHFGLSGPVALDISRYFLEAQRNDPGARLACSFLPGETRDGVDESLRSMGRNTLARFFRGRLPERLCEAVARQAAVAPETTGDQLSREARRTISGILAGCTIPVVGDRGFTYAEVTAGGVPLGELRLETMESRACPGLYLCGEICDVDGRIGGFNFQWAWSSGHVAGAAAIAAHCADLESAPPRPALNDSPPRSDR